MASKVSGLIEQIKVDNGNNLAIASTAYGYCEINYLKVNGHIYVRGV